MALWYGLRRTTARLAVLTGLSYVFYGWWDPRFCLLMLGSTVLDFWVGARIAGVQDNARRRAWLGLSLFLVEAEHPWELL